MALIHEKIIAVLREVSAIDKTKKNQQQGFMYRGVDDVMNEMHGLFSKHGIFLSSEIQNSSREERTSKQGGINIYSIIDYKFNLYAEDGTSVCTEVRGEGMDNGDKASNKCIAVALKYALFQMFMIPTKEMANDDPDRFSPEAGNLVGAPVQPVQIKSKSPVSKAKKRFPSRRENQSVFDRIIEYMVKNKFTLGWAEKTYEVDPDVRQEIINELAARM